VHRLVAQLEHCARDVADLPDVGRVQVTGEHHGHVERVVLRGEGRELLEKRRRLLGAHLGLSAVLWVARKMRRDEEYALA
jgi:hypothetical protein